MRKYSIPIFLLLLGGTIPFQINASSIQPQMAPTHAGSNMNPIVPVQNLNGAFQFPSPGRSATAVMHKSAIGQRRYRLLHQKRLRQVFFRMQQEISEQNRHERAAAAWGGASLFSAIVFITAGLLASSVLVYAFCLLAIPFGILAITRQRKARALGSKRNEGSVMGIVGMSIAGLGVTFVLLLAIVYLLY